MEGAQYGPIVPSSTSRTKRVACQSACVQCRRAKTRCDGQRPCARCVSHGRVDECMDRPTEEIERGKQNRKRKPRKANAKPTTDNTDNTALPPTHPLLEPIPPSPFVAESLLLTSAAARLAFGQSAVLRQSIVDRVNRLCATRPADDEGRKRFIRSIHMLLLKRADAVSPTEFDLFIHGRLPGTDPQR